MLVEPPASLRVFDAHGLEGSELTEALTAWSVARFAYGNEHGWPGGMLVLIQQGRAVRRRIFAPGTFPRKHHG